MIYDIGGKPADEYLRFSENLTIQYLYDAESSTAYYLTRIFKKKVDGTYQYPFIRNNGVNNRKSVYDLVTSEGWKIGINVSNGSGSTYIIENGILVETRDTPLVSPIMTIDNNGDMAFVEPEDVNYSAVPTGIISAAGGWWPIIENYEAVTKYDGNYTDEPDFANQKAQRQMFGQFSNGDYAIITSEGRSYDGSTGFTFDQARAVCIKHHIKNVMMLDGGGSTQTVIGRKNINTVYEQTTGRPIRVALVFNGTNNYVIPTT